MTEINAIVPVNEAELWSSTFGSGWETYSWWIQYRFIEGDWDVPGKVYLKADDPNSDEYIQRELTVNDLLEAWQKILNIPGGVWHCGQQMNDIDDFDACVGDNVLQMAMFGEIVYG